jgi:hypothetical protein
MYHMQYGEGYHFKCDVICFSMGSKCYKFLRVGQSFICVHAPTRDRHESKMSQNVVVSVTTNETPLFPFSARSRQNINIPKVAVAQRKLRRLLVLQRFQRSKDGMDQAVKFFAPHQLIKNN